MIASSSALGRRNEMGCGVAPTFQIAQVYQSFRDGRNPANGLVEEDYFETTQITRGFLEQLIIPLIHFVLLGFLLIILAVYWMYRRKIFLRL